jgi:hypothetical protein
MLVQDSHRHNYCKMLEFANKFLQFAAHTVKCLLLHPGFKRCCFFLSHRECLPWCHGKCHLAQQSFHKASLQAWALCPAAKLKMQPLNKKVWIPLDLELRLLCLKQQLNFFNWIAEPHQFLWAQL